VQCGPLGVGWRFTAVHRGDDSLSEGARSSRGGRRAGGGRAPPGKGGERDGEQERGENVDAFHGASGVGDSGIPSHRVHGGKS
jgi:hypothetical protein